MSENTSEQSEPLNSIPGDWLLQDFVGLINSLNLTVGITLQVSGVTVTGLAISGPTYFRLLGDIVAAGAKSGNVSAAAESMRKYFARHAEMYAASDDENSAHPTPGYIHVQDALILGSDCRPITKQGVLWRGRLSEVSGFSIGSFSID